MRTSYLGMALAAGLALASAESKAQVIVVGGGLDADCYWAAEYRTDLTRAFNVCTRALQIDDLSLRDRAATYTNRAVIRIRAGDFDGALADADRSLALMSSIGETHVNRGAALLELGYPEEALEAINRGLDLGVQRSYIAYYNRGAAKEKLGDIRGAYYDYKMAADARPDFLLAAEQLTRFTVRQVPTGASIERNDQISSTAENMEIARIAPPPWETQTE